MTSFDRKAKIWSIVPVSSGYFLEMYDFMVFGYYAKDIGNTFFPRGTAFVSLMLSLMTFGAGFFMRPLGAIVLGAYTDHRGRRAGLILTLSLMSVGIITIACTPGYATIEWLAPVLVLRGRLLQGFSAGMELGGVSVYLSEIATPRHKGFYVSWQSGQPAGRSHVRSTVRRCAELDSATRQTDTMGMAYTAPVWLSDHPLPICAPALASGD